MSLGGQVAEPELRSASWTLHPVCAFHCCAPGESRITWQPTWPAWFVCSLWLAESMHQIRTMGGPPGMQPSRPERSIMYQPPSLKTVKTDWDLKFSKGRERKATSSHLPPCPYSSPWLCFKTKVFSINHTKRFWDGNLNSKEGSTRKGQKTCNQLEREISG